MDDNNPSYFRVIMPGLMLGMLLTSCSSSDDSRALLRVSHRAENGRLERHIASRSKLLKEGITRSEIERTLLLNLSTDKPLCIVSGAAKLEVHRVTNRLLLELTFRTTTAGAIPHSTDTLVRRPRLVEITLRR